MVERGLQLSVAAAAGNATERDKASRDLLFSCSDFYNEPHEIQNIYGGWISSDGLQAGRDGTFYGKRRHIASFLAKFHPGALAVWFGVVWCDC